MLLQPIHNIAEICAKKNILNAILCPGSRSAALTISFVRHPKIKTFSISDERSAGFIGMGMALQTNQTVALVCTSGSAAYNFAPAVVEAFFQEIPLLVLTADRPSEWIHQYDGQTIYQNEIYGKHVKKSFNLPSDYSNTDAIWQIERVLNEAINLTQIEPKGPVHINVPIREPFYPTENEVIEFDKNIRTIHNIATQKTLSNEIWNQIYDIWNQSENKLIAVGQNNLGLSKILSQISDEFSIPVLGDVISNLNGNFIDFHDIFIGKSDKSNLKPDLLITAGKSFISKSFKQYIRANSPKFHIHIQENPELIDPFQTITHKIDVSPNYFFNQLFEDLDFQKFKEGDDEDENEYFENWMNLNSDAKKRLQKFINELEYCEFKTINKILNKLPNYSILHLGNSMPVRYANILGIESIKQIEVYANRGTSGIDGILSTAVGQALQTEKIVTVLIGDVSFFYDRNALWNNYLPKNSRIILLNNQGGNIFRIIDGPSKQPELDEYFETYQKFNAKNTALDAKIEYLSADSDRSLDLVLNDFYNDSNSPKLLEIFLDGKVNSDIFKKYKQL
jgi:2-succinyl-5-enolpyruvyl-6-hydroxy-3-cyclohexene-1-carboxylate synthase